jgi:hypothetical protein
MYQHNLKKQEEQMLIVFNRLSSLYYLSFTSRDIFHNKIIGLDGLRRKILIIEDCDQRYDFRFIDLCEVKTCKLKKTYNSVNGNDSKKNILEEYLKVITLQFNFKSESPPVALEFYRNITNSIFNMAELEHKAKQWEALVSKMLPLAEQKIA